MTTSQIQRTLEREKPRGERKAFPGTQGSALQSGKAIATMHVCPRCGRRFVFNRKRKRCPRCNGTLRVKIAIIKVF